MQNRRWWAVARLSLPLCLYCASIGELLYIPISPSYCPVALFIFTVVRPLLLERSVVGVSDMAIYRSSPALFYSRARLPYFLLRALFCAFSFKAQLANVASYHCSEFPVVPFPGCLCGPRAFC